MYLWTIYDYINYTERMNNMEETKNEDKILDKKYFNNFKGLTDIQSISNLIKKER